MARTSKFLAAVTVLLMLAGSNVFAQLDATLDLTSGYRDPSSSGGEFTAYLSGNSTVQNYVENDYYSGALYQKENQSGKVVATGFETFCVEVNVSFQAGTKYSASIGGNTPSGGGILPNGGTLTIGTAYLYSLFASGALLNYSYNGQNYNYDYTPGNGRELSADEMQDAIWYLQGEIGSNGNTKLTDTSIYDFTAASDPYVQLAENVLGTNAFCSDINDNYGVQVLELAYGNQPAQDQLIYCPVPEASTFAAGALMLVPLGWTILRRFRRKNASPDLVPASVGCERQLGRVSSRTWPQFWHRC